MAVLPDADRQAVCAGWMREPTGPLAVTKAQLRAAVDAIDSWVDSNALTFNLAIPQPARNALTARQKAWLLMTVIKRRFEVS